MFNYSNSTRSERQLKALTGLSKKQFEALLPFFSSILIEISLEAYQKNRTKRSRRPGGGQKGRLRIPENKLFFILFYLKNYPTFDVFGFIFYLSPSSAKENTSQLLPVLKRAQAKLNVLPKRRVKTDSELEEALETVGKPLAQLDPPSDLTSTKTPSLEQPAKNPSALETSANSSSSFSSYSSINSSFSNLDSSGERASMLNKRVPLTTTTESTQIPTETPTETPTEIPTETQTETSTETPLILIDVTERSHFRPKNHSKQKKYYSGKTKRHAVKNTLISDSKRRVVFFGRTFKGSSHDYKMFKQEFPSSQLRFSSVKIAVDLAYQGIQKDYPLASSIFIPHKKPKKSKANPNPSLIRKQKTQNKKIASK